MAFVPIIMGSRGDLDHAKKVAAALAGFGIESDLRVASAHKSPRHVMALLDAYGKDPRPKVYVTIAGRSNALSAFVDAYVAEPVIACPPYSQAYGGADIFSSLRMPSGVAPAVVIDPEGAALIAAKIFGVADAGLRARVADLQRANAEKLERDDAALQAEKA